MEIQDAALFRQTLGEWMGHQVHLSQIYIHTREWYAYNNVRNWAQVKSVTQYERGCKTQMELTTKHHNMIRTLHI